MIHFATALGIFFALELPPIPSPKDLNIPKPFPTKYLEKTHPRSNNSSLRLLTASMSYSGINYGIETNIDYQTISAIWVYNDGSKRQIEIAIDRQKELAATLCITKKEISLETGHMEWILEYDSCKDPVWVPFKEYSFPDEISFLDIVKDYCKLLQLRQTK